MTPSSTPMSDGQGFTRINDVRCPACNSPALFVGSGGYITCGNLNCPNPDYEDALAHHTKEAVLKARIDGMNELATELKRYDWQLEDSINSNDVVCEQIDFSLAELAATEQKRGGDADRS